MIKTKTFIRITRKHKKEYKFIINCEFCDKEFIKIGTDVKSKYCSKKCLALFRNKYITNYKNVADGLLDYYSKNDVWNKGFTKDTNKSICEMSKKLKSKPTWSSLNKDIMRNNSIGEKNGFYGKHHTKTFKEFKSKDMAEKISNGELQLGYNRFFRGWYFSSKNNCHFYYDSFWELLRMKILDVDFSVVEWTKKHKIKIPYIYKNINHYYVPDFLITYRDKKILEEIKGWENNKRLSKKLNALKKYCKKNNLKYNIIKYSDMEQLAKIYYYKSIKTLREEYKNG